MNEYLLEAREELKRLEHIIYVSLKYTRTVDVLRNALNRMVSMFDLVVDAFLEKAKEEGLIDLFPKSPALRAKRVEEMYPEDKELHQYLAFYAFLKNILKKEFQKREEYRRHVTMTLEIDNSTAEVNIDNLMNCEKYVHLFYNYALEKIDGIKNED
ncbi:MAG: hypothetical protein Q8R37_03270 [Nanoarchaeota archaeon]|nr:hypothetical protein [Nanoarchaeota archaeon]